MTHSTDLSPPRSASRWWRGPFYKVVRSEVVLPSQVGDLAIEPGEDLLTLVACTPYGVNDHRLLVRCERCAHHPKDAAEQGSLTRRRWGAREWVVATTCFGLAALGVWEAVSYARRPKAA